MAKEVRGWREPNDWDYRGNDTLLAVMDNSSQSDDGWTCPHCGAKETLENAEMPTETTLRLLFSQEPVKEYCNHCDKEYFVKCYTSFSYYSCADKKFEEA